MEGRRSDWREGGKERSGGEGAIGGKEGEGSGEKKEERRERIVNWWEKGGKERRKEVEGVVGGRERGKW